MPTREKIIQLANKICKESFMDHPDYDEDEPITNLADALTILIMEAAPHDTDLESQVVYDYLDNVVLKNT